MPRGHQGAAKELQAKLLPRYGFENTFTEAANDRTLKFRVWKSNRQLMQQRSLLFSKSAHAEEEPSCMLEDLVQERFA